MAKVFEVYKCELCGNIAEVVHAGAAPLHCCGQAMKVMKENTVDAAKEKHIPVAERSAAGLLVKVGSVAHPMEEKHFIEWIELIGEHGEAYMHFLKPGEKPEALFNAKVGKYTIREYCNLHGLWKTEI